MGKPNITGFQMVLRRDECIVPDERTQGTDTSQYLEERKSTENPLVAAIERGYSPSQASAWGFVSEEELQRRC